MLKHPKIFSRRGSCGLTLRGLAPAAGLTLGAAVLLAVTVRQSLATGKSLAVDPGVRGGTVGAGGFVKGLTTDQNNVLTDITPTYKQVNGVPLTPAPGGL